MSDVSSTVVVANSQYVKVLAWILALTGLALIVVRFWFAEPVSSLGELLLWEGLAFVLIGRALLRSHIELRSRSLVVRRWWSRPTAFPWPAKPTVFSWEEIDEVQVRRYLFFDRAAVHTPGEGLVLLPAPIRLRFLRDPSFDHALEEVGNRASTSVPQPTPAPRKLRLRNLAGLLVLLVIPPMTWVVNVVPWTQPWWPGLHQATRVPNACQVLDQPVRSLLGSTSTAKPDGLGDGCNWDAGQTHLTVTYYLTLRSTTASGIDRAHSLLRVFNAVDWGRGGWEPGFSVPGLGDESWIIVSPPGGRPNLWLHARRANVLISIFYQALGTSDQAIRTCEQIARTALADIVVN